MAPTELFAVVDLDYAANGNASRDTVGESRSHHDVADVHRKLQYDFYYIKYFSPWLDTLIVFRTIKTMLTGFGAR